MILNLYENLVRSPEPAELAAQKHMAFLAYVTPYASTLIEYAGRTCYKSFQNISATSYQNFIEKIVASGHESVIEHSNMVYVVFKKSCELKGTDCPDINRVLIDVMLCNRLISISETKAFYVISGNIRMFKDLIRKYFEVKRLNGKTNQIMDDIYQSFYRLPKYYFVDMVKDFPDFIDESKFKLDERVKEAAPKSKIIRINDYLSVLNQDYFSLKVKGFIVRTLTGNEVRRVSLPINLLKKHNRLTVEITAPRYITHQLVRHRMASYSQSSQRYVDESNGRCYTPQSIIDKGYEMTATNLYNQCLVTYSTMKNMGVLKEDARAVLPNAMMSTIVMTATIEEFEHMCKERSSKAAQSFFREYIAKPIKEYIDKYYSSMESEFRVKTKQEIKVNNSEAASYKKKLQAKQQFKKGAKLPKKQNSEGKFTHNKEAAPKKEVAHNKPNKTYTPKPNSKPNNSKPKPKFNNNGGKRNFAHK